MSGKYPGLPRVKMSTVDVRDCAEAHLQAILKPEAANKRFITSNDDFWFEDMAQVLRDEFGSAYPIPKRLLPYPLVWLGSWFDGKIESVRKMWGREFKVKNDRSREILGINYRPGKQTLIEFANYLIDNDYLPDNRAKK